MKRPQEDISDASGPPPVAAPIERFVVSSFDSVFEILDGLVHFVAKGSLEDHLKFIKEAAKHRDLLESRVSGHVILDIIVSIVKKNNRRDKDNVNFICDALMPHYETLRMLNYMVDEVWNDPKMNQIVSEYESTVTNKDDIYHRFLSDEQKIELYARLLVLIREKSLTDVLHFLLNIGFDSSKIRKDIFRRLLTRPPDPTLGLYEKSPSIGDKKLLIESF